MYQISKDELEQIKGGGISAGWVVAGISAIVVFVTGLIDGYKPQCLHKRV